MIESLPLLSSSWSLALKRVKRNQGQFNETNLLNLMRQPKDVHEMFDARSNAFGLQAVDKRGSNMTG